MNVEYTINRLAVYLVKQVTALNLINSQLKLNESAQPNQSIGDSNNDLILGGKSALPNVLIWFGSKHRLNQPAYIIYVAIFHCIKTLTLQEGSTVL